MYWLLDKDDMIIIEIRQAKGAHVKIIISLHEFSNMT